MKQLLYIQGIYLVISNIIMFINLWIIIMIIVYDKLIVLLILSTPYITQMGAFCPTPSAAFLVRVGSLNRTSSTLFNVLPIDG